MIQEPINKYFEENNPKAVVFHVDLGTYAGTLNHLKYHATASYHFYIKKNGDVVQFVPVNKGAWHSGVVSNPNERAKKFFTINPNKMSIGICYEGKQVGNDGEKATEAQVKACKKLLKELKIEKLPRFAHQEITSYKPMSVYDFMERLEDKTCTLDKFTTTELLGEIISRWSK